MKEARSISEGSSGSPDALLASRSSVTSSSSAPSPAVAMIADPFSSADSFATRFFRAALVNTRRQRASASRYEISPSAASCEIGTTAAPARRQASFYPVDAAGKEERDLVALAD